MSLCSDEFFTNKILTISLVVSVQDLPCYLARHLLEQTGMDIWCPLWLRTRQGTEERKINMCWILGSWVVGTGVSSGMSEHTLDGRRAGKLCRSGE